ncbi:MAG: adenylyltransferase/cytidyltransferase family protein [Thermoproteota archaeon]|jgi:FAD synthetase|nr:adenylyltransferase/cytidyltransferase family protein [Thermoproteota archaeon]
MKKEKKVMVSGTFEILHPGHIHLFKEASKLGKVYVVVARDENVRRFKKREPIVNEKQRLEVVKSVKYVHRALLGNPGENIFEIIKKIKPDIILLGPDQNVDENKLKEFLKENSINAEVRRLPKRIDKDLYDTSKIIKRIYELNIKIEE